MSHIFYILRSTTIGLLSLKTSKWNYYISFPFLSNKGSAEVKPDRLFSLYVRCEMRQFEVFCRESPGVDFSACVKQAMRDGC